MFLDKGIENTTATDITETADVAYGTFYNYFKSVGDVVPVVAEEMLREINEGVKELQRQHHDPVRKIAIGVNFLFKRVMSNPAINWLTQKPNIMAEEISRIISEDAIEHIQQGVESGDFQPPCEYQSLQTFLLWGFTGALHEVTRKPEQLQQSTQDITLIFLRILGVSDAKARKVTQDCSDLG